MTPSSHGVQTRGHARLDMSEESLPGLGHISEVTRHTRNTLTDPREEFERKSANIYCDCSLDALGFAESKTGLDCVGHGNAPSTDPEAEHKLHTKQSNCLPGFDLVSIVLPQANLVALDFLS
jgi:hypothetical protein